MKRTTRAGGDRHTVLLRRVERDFQGGWWNDCADEYELGCNEHEARALGARIGSIVGVCIFCEGHMLMPRGDG